MSRHHERDARVITSVIPAPASMFAVQRVDGREHLEPVVALALVREESADPAEPPLQWLQAMVSSQLGDCTFELAEADNGFCAVVHRRTERGESPT